MEKIWLESYPAGVPSTINPDTYSSVIDLLRETFERYSDKPAMENFGVSITYRTLFEKSLQLAAFFQQELNLQKGDRLAIMLPNVLQYPITLLAALHLGLIIVNINPLYTEREMLLPLVDSGAVAIVVFANFANTLIKVAPSTALKHIIVTELGDDFNFFKRIVFNSYLKYIKKSVPAYSSPILICYRHALNMGKKNNFEPVNILPDDIVFLQYTGGTTGIPKGAMLTHRNLIANILQCVAWINHVLEEGKEVVVTALPLYHIFSLTICCFAFLKLGGLSYLITNPRDIPGFIKQLAKIPFTVFIGVNTLYHALLENPGINTIDFSKLKLSLAGGMSVMKTVAEEWQVVTGKPIILGYGLTEASPVVTINPLTLTFFKNSIGLPIPSTEIAILDEAGNNVPLGKPGELCVSGPQVMKGYWHQPDETKLVLDEKGWLRTGDIAMMNEEGYIYLIDRKKDMILVSGFNVYPSEIEAVIASHPGVQEVAVIGISDIDSGEMVKAFIVKKDNTLNEEDIRKLCKQKLTGYKQPKVIEFCSELPKSNVGKVLKQKLRETNANSLNPSNVN